MTDTDVKKTVPLRGLIFDYGGTIDSRGVHWSEVIWDGFQACGYTYIDKEVFREAYVYAERYLATHMVILPQDNFYQLMLKKMRLELGWLSENVYISPADVAIGAPRIAQYCYDRAKECADEARGVLDRLSSHLPMVLVSNFYGNIESVLSDFGLLHYFRCIIESSVVGVRKPDPRIFSMGVDALGLRPEEVLVVGDSFRKDIVPAESIGCRVAWLKGKGWTDEEDAIEHPSIIKKLNDVIEVALR